MYFPPRVLIISPALAAANNGNWQTARRWSDALASSYRVEVRTGWGEADAAAEAAEPPALMIALHARRSAEAIAGFARTGRPVILVLTGTDLYRDLQTDPQAQRSLALATHRVVLNDCGLERMPPAFRETTSVIVQSAPAMAPIAPRRGCFDLALVGHLRVEKDPLTAVRALASLEAASLRLIHVGAASDPTLAAAMQAAAQADSRIELRGPLSHARTRREIARSRVLLLPSLMEGGANVLIEAIASGVPVLASRIEGNLGLLGPDWPAYFEVGDPSGLAMLIRRCLESPDFLGALQERCVQLAPRFAPAREAGAVRALVHNALAAHPRSHA